MPSPLFSLLLNAALHSAQLRVCRAIYSDLLGREACMSLAYKVTTPPWTWLERLFRNLRITVDGRASMRAAIHCSTHST